MLLHIPLVGALGVPPVNAGIDVLLAEGYTEIEAFVWGKLRTQLSKTALKRELKDRAN